MNAQLVKTLAQIIRTLSEEERELLDSEIRPLSSDIETLEKMRKLGDKIQSRRQGKPLKPNPEELIREMREERIEQIIQAGLTNED
ncbi:MAG: hypothetical protein F6K35_30240 [Okeania sp. SIO2H7]|nr:hypothetical protein [Okeania sp. SIO2H7]